MEDRFKVLGTYGKRTIPWIVIAPHEAQAIYNHGQTLERLNERGGLCWSEMLAVLEDRKYQKIDESVAYERVQKIVNEYIYTVRMVKDDDGHYVPLDCCIMTNPKINQSGRSEIDSLELPCGSECDGYCNTCIIQRIMDEYAELTNQIS